jgi:hypothetical protein
VGDFFYDFHMCRLPWFLVFAIAFQLCLGSAWASPAGDGAETQHSSDAAQVANAHCHEENGVSASASTSIDSASAANQDQGLSCCSTSHCNLCSATGLPIETFATVSLPDTPNISAAAPLVVNWALPPELRPPI